MASFTPPPTSSAENGNRPSLPDLGYGFLESRGKAETKIVIFSVIKSRPSHHGLRLGLDTLFLWEHGASTYYTRHCPQAVRALSRRIGPKTKRVILIGQSKAGYGAYAWGCHLGRLRPDLEIAVLCFSPQASLWPPRELPFASYRQLLKLANDNSGIARDLAAHGTLPPKPPNFRADIIYGSQSQLDTDEAQILAHYAAPLGFTHPLAQQSHNSLVPFLAGPKRGIDLIAKAICKTADDDPDMGQWVNEISSSDFAHQWDDVGPVIPFAQLIQNLAQIPFEAALPIRP